MRRRSATLAIAALLAILAPGGVGNLATAIPVGACGTYNFDNLTDPHEDGHPTPDLDADDSSYDPTVTTVVSRRHGLITTSMVNLGDGCRNHIISMQMQEDGFSGYGGPFYYQAHMHFVVNVYKQIGFPLCTPRTLWATYAGDITSTNYTFVTPAWHDPSDAGCGGPQVDDVGSYLDFGPNFTPTRVSEFMEFPT
jgi:hypothetical protein